jgi:hypothetical protein
MPGKLGKPGKPVELDIPDKPEKPLPAVRLTLALRSFIALVRIVEKSASVRGVPLVSVVYVKFV